MDVPKAPEGEAMDVERLKALRKGLHVFVSRFDDCISSVSDLAAAGVVSA